MVVDLRGSVTPMNDQLQRKYQDSQNSGRGRAFEPCMVE
jgi:hypothetical protein